jgi:hypothetical protein
LPEELRKNPELHLAHSVPLSDLVQPALQVHEPSASHLPFRQLHVDGAFWTSGTRQRPEPEMPSSHLLQFDGQAWHCGPKKPGEHASHAVPLKPDGQAQVPAAVHTPAPAQAGEQDVPWMSRSASAPDALVGSCATSGRESHRTTRLLDEPAATATHTPGEIASDAAFSAIGAEALPVDELARPVNAAPPL